MTTTDYANYCRFCLKECSEFSVDIFKDENGRSLAREVSVFMPYVVQETPLWPRRACLDCVEYSLALSKFYQLAIVTHKTLSRKLSSRIPPVNAKIGTIVIDDDDEPNLDDAKEDKVDPISLTDTPGDKLSADIRVETSPVVKEETAVKVDPPDRNEEFLDDPSESPSELDSNILIEAEDFDSFGDLIEYVGEDVENSGVGEKEELEMPPTKTRRKSAKYASVVRVTSYMALTEEEKKLETLMLDMKLFECHLCGEDTKTFHGLQKHIRVRHWDSRDSYEICCNVKAKVPGVDLYDHIRFHLDKDAFTCRECGHQAKTTANLKGHITTMHSTGAPKFVCEICGAAFMRKTKLEEHCEKTHEEKKACHLCSNVFTTQYSLKLHIDNVHERVTNFLCDLCGKGFPKKRYLTSHIRDHGGPHGGGRKKNPKKKDPEPESATSPRELERLFKYIKG